MPKKLDRRTNQWRRRTTYAIWYQVIQRCTNPNHESYADYGGRGIKVEPCWVPLLPDRPSLVAFANFIKDVGLRPNQYLSLDRKDPNGNYEKDNVRWANSAVQARNKRESIYIPDPNPPHDLIPAAELAQRLGMRYQTLRYKLVKLGQWPGNVGYGKHINLLAPTPAAEEET